jgi:hypothetical protein
MRGCTFDKLIANLDYYTSALGFACTKDASDYYRNKRLVIYERKEHEKANGYLDHRYFFSVARGKQAPAALLGFYANILAVDFVREGLTVLFTGIVHSTDMGPYSLIICEDSIGSIDPLTTA